MFYRIISERINAHAEDKHEDVTEQNRKRMTNEQINKALGRWRPEVLVFRHDRKGADVRTAQLGIVIMVMVMGTAPDAAGTHRVNTKHAHQHFRHARTRKDRVMLLIMVNDKKAQNEEPAQDTAREFGRRMDIPKGASERQGEEDSSGKDVPPAFQS